MRLLPITVIVFVAFTGCRRQDALLTVPTEAVHAPAMVSVIVTPGSNLGKIGADAYGHERFSGFVARLNNISDPERIGAGTMLKTPSLSIAFHDAGLDPKYQPALNTLAKACTDFYDVLPAYLKARGASGVGTGTFAIPPHIASTFRSCADSIDAATRFLEDVRPPHVVPQLTIEQFRKTSPLLRELAAGSIDGYGYDYDMVGQRFGLAFTNAIIWTQQDHR